MSPPPPPGKIAPCKTLCFNFRHEIHKNFASYSEHKQSYFLSQFPAHQSYTVIFRDTLCTDLPLATLLTMVIKKVNMGSENYLNGEVHGLDTPQNCYFVGQCGLSAGAAPFESAKCLREREFTNFNLFSTAQTHLEDPLEKGSFSFQQTISEVEAWSSALVGRG